MIRAAKTRLTEFQRELYHRNILLPQVGEDGQLRLLDSRVLVIGAGGLGSPILLYLAAAGVGELGIADDDTVSLSNLQRQILYTRQDVGKSKAGSAQEKLERIRPHLRFRTYVHRITSENVLEILEPYHFIIDATDNFPSKFMINDACVRLGKPFSHAGVTEMYGQTMTVIPGQSPCVRCVFKEAPPEGAVPPADTVGILGTVPGVVGAVQATEALKYLLRCGELLTGKLLTWDALTMDFRVVSLPDYRGCSLCRRES